MTNVSCCAQNCAYNKNECCYKQKINVEGLFSRSKLGTFCESFKTAKEKRLYELELGSDMQNEALEAFEVKTDVTCSANYCEHNKGNRCVKSAINVGPKAARYRSETECASFKLK